MKKIELKQTNLISSPIGLGCMRIADCSKVKVEKLIKESLEEGINFFDHADIYGNGESEKIFSEAIELKDDIRDKMIIQTKCGIRNGYYDGSKEHIINSLENSLKRLKTDYVDILLIHRPDPLMELEEIAEAFQVLHNSGKVKYFGVSNHNATQIELLNRYCNNKIVFNQMQFGIMHSEAIDYGINFNMNNNESVNREGSIIEYCRLKDINLQAWSPFQYGFFEGNFLDNPKFPKLNEKLDELAKKYNVTNMAIATAWILRHPAQIQTIVGTTNAERIKLISKGAYIQLTREEWYDIYKSTGKMIP